MSANRTRSESGQAAIELIGYVVLVVAAAIVCVQGVFAVQAAVAAQEAARDGARALSLGEDWRLVVDHTLPDWVETQAVEGAIDGDRARVQVEVKVPIGLGAVTFGDLDFVRSADFPMGR